MNNEVFLDALAITVILVSPGMFAQGLWVTSGKPFLPYLSSYFTARAYVTKTGLPGGLFIGCPAALVA